MDKMATEMEMATAMVTATVTATAMETAMDSNLRMTSVSWSYINLFMPRFCCNFETNFSFQLQTVTMATAMDTTTNSPKMISSQATATAIMDSTVTQATGHKMTSNQHHHSTTQTISTYRHRPIHLNRNLNDPTTHTSHRRKTKIAPMAMETAISTHKAAIDTRARAQYPAQSQLQPQQQQRQSSAKHGR